MSGIIEVKELSKIYKMYNKPSERIKEALFPKSFGKKVKEFYALRDVSFSVEKGETVGIIGKNGSGKSTLLKILTGVIKESGGMAKVDGKVSALLELGAGFNPEYTGIENIYLNGTIMGFTREQMKEKIDEITDFAEIGEFINHPVKNYSSGMFVRLAFAVAINVSPEILIVDEALAVGDYRFQAKCYKKFEELKNMGKTILFVTHDVDTVRRFCTRAVWIDSGRLVMDGGAREVTSKYMEFITGSETDAFACVRGEKKEKEKKTEKTSDFNPINRFGSNVGCVEKVRILKEGEECEVFSEGDEIEIEMTVNIPNDADLKDVGAAVSLKDKNGLDLFVSTLHDKDMRFLSNGRKKISFKFTNYLNSGSYTVTAGLENRKCAPIAYFDYIEGAAYIKCVCDKEYFGLLRFPSDIEIGETADE